MSMPKISTNCHPISRDQAINDFIESIALEETALSHILNAEGEKLQKAIEISSCVDELLSVNCSVESMVKSITELIMVLKGKMDSLQDLLQFCLDNDNDCKKKKRSKKRNKPCY